RSPPKEIMTSPKDREPSLSGLGYVVDKLLKLLHRVPMAFILPHLDSPDSPILSNQSSKWMNDTVTYGRNRHAIVVSPDNNEFHQTVQKTSSELRNDRLDIVTPQLA